MKKKYMSERLTKKEKKQILRDLRKHEQQEFHNSAAKEAYRYCLELLTNDHESRLHSALRHIARFQALDKLQGDAIHSDYCMADYLSMYGDDSRTAVLAEIKEAQTALKWLRRLVEAEQNKRVEAEQDFPFA